MSFHSLDYLETTTAVILPYAVCKTSLRSPITDQRILVQDLDNTYIVSAIYSFAIIARAGISTLIVFLTFCCC